MKISLCTYQSLMKEGRTMETGLTREEALQALQTYNHEPFHLQHALTVEAVMGWFAKEEGFEAESDFWRMAGLLHDIDFEQWPEQHCVKCIELLQSAHATPELIHAVCCHGYGICTDVEPTLPMEKILFAADELTGLIGAAAKMRPSKSCTDMELSSLKKKFKDKKFAAGCSRDVIRAGAERLGWTLDELLEKTLHAMADTESTVAEELNLLLQA
jgi:Predicted hydrolase (HD superfamily)